MKRSLLSLLALAATVAVAAPLTNDDIVKMLQAGLSEEIVLTTILHAETAFDTSPNGLIALSQAGVPEKVVQAMIAPAAAKPAPAAGPAADAVRPDVVVAHFDGKSEEMRFVVPSMRTAARGLGFGGVATYMVLRGSNATLRMGEAQPSFTVSIPTNAQPESYVDLASFAVRKNNSREVLVGGGYMSYSTGIHPDRRMPFTVEKLADQAKATDGFTLYTLTPQNPLAAGEYAVVFYNSEIAVPGFFGSGSNSCFDFAVE